jgi:hypothetical protein
MFGNDLETASHYRIVVCTCVSAGVLYSLGIKAGHFTHVIIDEVRASHYRIVVCTCVSAGVLYSLGIKAGHFMQVIIGEVIFSHYRIVYMYLLMFLDTFCIQRIATIL